MDGIPHRVPSVVPLGRLQGISMDDSYYRVEITVDGRTLDWNSTNKETAINQAKLEAARGASVKVWQVLKVDHPQINSPALIYAK